ncbi:MAG: class I SAM-dependent methyltransferase [Candidatus Omnitrophota bacterium]|jgi:2-polyprenyl-3-methyl-5-hydroxy-6-metoxy-1,4-benzoquinol methylase
MTNNHAAGIQIKKRLLPFREFHCPDKPYMDLTPEQSGIVNAFNHRVDGGEIELESIPCLCGSTVFDLVASVDRYSMHQKTVMCSQCGLLQSNPRMTDRQYRDFYSSDMYRLCYEGEDYLDVYKKRYDPEATRHIFDAILRVKKIGPGVDVLELGAGGGWNLVPFSASGANATGIDYSESLVKMGRGHGLNMQQGGIEKITGLFDIIVINHALEHFPDPVGSLQNIVQHLKADGLIYIAVPNIMNFGIGQLQNAHTYYFTPATFEHYCRKAGLIPVRTGAAETVHMFGIFITAKKPSPVQLKDQHREMLAFFGKVKLKHIAKTILSKIHLYNGKLG